MKQRADHGSIESYLIGFGLSWLLTVIPYYLVVNKSISGTALLGTIVALAIVQMVIQVVFFLHLGRGPKPLYNITFFVFTVATVVMVVGAALFIMQHLYQNMSPQEVSKKLVEDEGIYQIDGRQTGACHGRQTRHKVTIKNGLVSPNHIQARHCDSLIFINQDDSVRHITFGAHPKQESYGGERELSVRKSRSKMIILNQAGTYQFHDHHDPKVTGRFTVME